MPYESFFAQAAKKFICTNMGNISFRFIPRAIICFNRQTLRQINTVYKYVNTPQRALAFAGGHIFVVSYSLYEFKNELLEIQESNESEQVKNIKKFQVATQFLKDTVGIPLTPRQIIEMAWSYNPQPYDARIEPAANNNKTSLARINQMDH